MTLSERLRELLTAGPQAINLGLASFAEALQAQGAGVVHVAWSPPPPEVEEVAELLDRLL